jgi:hypothetical protein
MHLLSNILLMSCLLALLPAGHARAGLRPDQGDLRRFMHGVAAVPAAEPGSFNVFFSSAGLPPRGPDRAGSWTHDVYVQPWRATDGAVGRPRVFIARPEAQEPVSAARNTRGRVMLTFEDGWRSGQEVSQRYGVYDAALRPVKPYPQTVEAGTHSGHVAAVGERFVLFYSDGWVDGGGVDDLGSGNGVYAGVYDADGRPLYSLDIADGQRAWWPMLAGAERVALLLWQQFVPGRQDARLKMALLDVYKGTISGERVLWERLQYYSYNLIWLPEPARFLLAGNADGHGFAMLVDSAGRTQARLDCLPLLVREAGMADAGNSVYLPAADGRLMQLVAGSASLRLAGLLAASNGRPVSWRPLGSVGLVRSNGLLDWLSLTEAGPQWLHFDPAMAVPAGAADSCRQTG